MIALRAPDGRYASQPGEPAPTQDEALRIYESYLAAICRHQGLTPNGVRLQLQRAGRPNRCIAWREATYARQLALYLSNTGHNVPQVMLAEAAGMTAAAVCVAIHAIEDLREHTGFDRSVDMVAAEMGAG